MIVFRLSKSKFSNDLSGKGAEKTGGRWNSKGTPMIYTGMTRALCTTEIAVHMPLGNLPKDYSLITIEFPDTLNIIELESSKLSFDWKSMPYSNSTQMIGDKFINENKYSVMKVPSVVVQGEFNYLINPYHSENYKIKVVAVEPFVFDERLFIK